MYVTIEHYTNGNIKSIYSIDKDGKKNGPFLSYYPNRRLHEKCFYENGKRHGLYEAYHSFGGKIGRRCYYKNGFKDGPDETYNLLGLLSDKNTYYMGVCLPEGIDQSYLKRWEKKHLAPQEARQELNQELDLLNKQEKPTFERQKAKREKVAEFRKKYPQKSIGRKASDAQTLLKQMLKSNGR